MATKKTRTPKGTKKAPKRAKQPAKRTTKIAKRSKSSEPSQTNRGRLIEAGVINADYVFSPQDAESIETLSNQEVNVLIEVFEDLGAEFFENNSPNGFVF